MYFKDELKHSKRFNHVTYDVMSLFWLWKNYQLTITFLQISTAVWRKVDSL